MEGRRQRRPRISRETRLLLLTVTLAAVALGVLDRVRSFETRPAVGDSARPLLAPLLGRPAIDELSSDLARLDARIRPWLASIALPGGGPVASLAAVRLRDDLVLALVDDDAALAGAPAPLVARDRATGLTVFRIAAPPFAPPLPVWSGEVATGPRYFLVVEPAGDGLSVRPLLLSGLSSRAVPAWREPVWALPAGIAPGRGSLLFTTAAEFAGALVDGSGGVAFVPAPALVAEADRALARAGASPGDLAVEVEGLQPAVAAIVGAEYGVVVTWADPGGPAGDRLRSGDVVQAIDGDPIRTPDEWAARVRRLHAGDDVRLRVARAGEVRDVRVMASAAVQPPRASAPASSARALGLSMRLVPGLGTSVAGVAAGSRAALAGLRAGDIITRAGTIDAPTPDQLRRSSGAGPVLLSVTRGARHHVFALQP